MFIAKLKAEENSLSKLIQTKLSRKKKKKNHIKINLKHIISEKRRKITRQGTI